MRPRSSAARGRPAADKADPLIRNLKVTPYRLSSPLRVRNPLSPTGSDDGPGEGDQPPLNSEIVAPVGSVMTEKRPTLGMSVGGTQTFPPTCSAFFVLASTSSTAT